MVEDIINVVVKIYNLKVGLSRIVGFFFKGVKIGVLYFILGLCRIMDLKVRWYSILLLFMVIRFLRWLKW